MDAKPKTKFSCTAILKLLRRPPRARAVAAKHGRRLRSLLDSSRFCVSGCASLSDAASYLPAVSKQEHHVVETSLVSPGTGYFVAYARPFDADGLAQKQFHHSGLGSERWRVEQMGT
jgi:hypothetical protein